MEEDHFDPEHLFDQIDLNSKGFITEYDLGKFLKYVSEESD